MKIDDFEQSNVRELGSPQLSSLGIEFFNEFISINDIRLRHLSWRVDTHNGVFDRHDLLQEGRLAVLLALKNFDPNKGALEPYVHASVKSRVYRYSDQNSFAVKLPSYIAPYIRIYHRAKWTVAQELSRVPSAEEVVSCYPLPMQPQDTRWSETTPLTTEGAEFYKLAETIPTAETTEEEVVRKSAAKVAVEAAFLDAGLNEKEKEVIRLRYRFEKQAVNGESELLGYPEIGRKLNLTTQRVHQIGALALEKLKMYFNRPSQSDISGEPGQKTATAEVRQHE